ncbi:hypothetical protein ADK75_13530 [Streptomyces virginiae]|uniref:HTH cro/C1-type domain-containing protein n=1 Tax=Streptomyces virginiae TaxID=1961 RepID=A0A0L8MW75_STRVG|nr:hypothetical protein ADK75_13530 [Streptomyces virginiae]
MGEFLRTRRALLHPENVALPDFGGRRRVAGLRREEIAQLAGVSVDYYTRMEQGRVPNPSSAVLDALARALRLDGDATRTKRFHHRVVGDLELAYETLRATDDPDQALITYAAEPGSPSHDALRMLLAWATEAPSPMPTDHRAGR